MSLFYRRPATALTDWTLFLDLDETLGHTFENESDAFQKLLQDKSLIGYRYRIYNVDVQNANGSKYNMYGIQRPYCREFLTFCQKYFNKVMVWSAGRKRYVESFCNYLFRDIADPDEIYTYDDIESGVNKTVLKPLSKFNMDLSKTLIIDDNKNTFAQNVDNAIHIPAYNPTPDVNGLLLKDDALEKIMKWLENKDVMQATDVRKLDKSKIFST